MTELDYTELYDGTVVYEDGVIEWADGSVGHVDDLDLEDDAESPEPYDDDLEPEDAFSEGFNRTLECVEHERGRSLTHLEVDRLYDAADREDNPSHVDESAVYDRTTA